MNFRENVPLYEEEPVAESAKLEEPGKICTRSQRKRTKRIEGRI